MISYAGVRIDEVGWTVIQLMVDQPADQQRSVYCRLDIYKVSWGVQGYHCLRGK